ncbi:hypothetical protein IR150_08285 [Providencia alcalifaciens]|uniref:hypothetical protein n=1 Tax=Providencia alcalifaciens TaxID=126385 RepID=UPI0015D048DC|nr:hypothetical protein [Providencia alcalifaciens]MBF0691485.1 hypothetical protein [Providencia alcalifaciens]NYS89989.1 hypothetical protein [Providencia alcalifaciens]
MNKINFLSIIKLHFQTLVDQKGKWIYSDIIFHLIMPIVVGLLICIFDGTMTTQIAAIFVNFGAITTALLMSAVVMIYGQKQKVKEKIKESKNNEKNSDKNEDLIILEMDNILYRQLCHNISYAILGSALIVLLSVAISFFTTNIEIMSYKLFFLYILSFFCYAIFISTIITFFMIIKRFSAVIDD